MVEASGSNKVLAMRLPFGRVVVFATAVLLAVLSAGTALAAVDGFSDVYESTEHHDDIMWLADTEISTGFPDGTFRPMDTVKRCDMAAFLYRLAGSPSYTPSAEDKRCFSDVGEGTPHADEVWWLAKVGIS